MWEFTAYHFITILKLKYNAKIYKWIIVKIKYLFIELTKVKIKIALLKFITERAVK